VSEELYTALSLGAGVQSSTLAMMMVHGELPMADVAIFADTGAEPKRVYQWLDWLEARIVPAGLPLVRVMQGEGLTAHLDDVCGTTPSHSTTPPMFTPSGGCLNRNCTRDYKLRPIFREIQRRRKKRRVVQIMGISWEERQRCKPPRQKYIARNEYPLVDMEMDRQGCKRWMLAHGYPIPPLSACVYCPYRCDLEWRKLKAEDPEGFAEACRVDEMCRTRLPGVRAHNGHKATKCYVHRSLVSLRDVDFSNDIDRGQQLLPGVSGWADCEGMCGL